LSSQPQQTEVDPHSEELRVALALNGGVSLAVWMGGCAVELDRARRAGKGRPDARIYDKLCECFGRRLVIDIITGTSAGGINGALLGAAMAKGCRLDADFIRGRWIELGDLGKIMYPASEESPTALMDGKQFQAKLLAAFEDVLRTPDPSGQLTPSLDVTMTDAVGVERRFRDTWGGELIAREHRPRFRFRRQEHFSAEALSEAARTTASFPFAFDPWRVAGNPMVLADLERPTFGLDGGLLDNAPIREAVELIPSRPATTTVRRYLCYLNADPELSRETDLGPEPGLKEVGGYVVNLPRTAPLVDHLYAIRDAVERPKRAQAVQDKLLGIEDLAELETVAQALFKPYCERRTLESLEELISDPGDANATFDLLQKVEGELPWIPSELRQGSTAPWEWGARAAQRAIHLLLDLLRPLIDDAGEKDRRRLLEARSAIGAQLARLDETHEEVTRAEVTRNPSRFDPEKALERVNKAADATTARAEATREAVVEAARVFRKEVARDCPGTLRRALFGEAGEPPEEAIEHFIRRALAIEVVRRAFATDADIESAQRLHFVQLTPEAPSPLFAADPLKEPSPASAAEKLAGVGLHHFAGFYRRSWRANDFMWGRLDAATRIVDLLLDSPSADTGTGATDKRRPRLDARSGMLAKALLDSAGEDGAWLIEEMVPQPAKGSTHGKNLEQRLTCLIRGELAAAEDGEDNPLPCTRALFQRAAQLEIFREERTKLHEESELDSELGSAAKPLPIGEGEDEGKVKADVEAVREVYEKGGSLPHRLTAEGEAVSDLGLQTITHAAFVGLAAIRTAGVPMSKFLGLARPPLLAVAGTVAARWIPRAVALLGFWAAALFLTSRAVTTLASTEPGSKPGEYVGELNFDAVWAPQTLVALAALLGALGFVAVPGLRVRQGVSPVKNFVYATALVLAAGGLAAVLALAIGGLSVERLIFATGAESPPEAALWAVLALVGLATLSRLPLPSWAKPLAAKLERARSHGWLLYLTLTAGFAVLGYYSVKILLDAFEKGTWEKISILTAFVAAPVAAGCAVSIWRNEQKAKQQLARTPRPTGAAGPTSSG
jgi:predicted acylesterase/phospholipase RssA